MAVLLAQCIRDSRVELRAGVAGRGSFPTRHTELRTSGLQPLTLNAP